MKSTVKTAMLNSSKKSDDEKVKSDKVKDYCEKCPNCDKSYKMPTNNCENDLSGAECADDHIKLLCGSVNDQCAMTQVAVSDDLDIY